MRIAMRTLPGIAVISPSNIAERSLWAGPATHCSSVAVVIGGSCTASVWAPSAIDAWAIIARHATATARADEARRRLEPGLGFLADGDILKSLTPCVRTCFG